MIRPSVCTRVFTRDNNDIDFHLSLQFESPRREIQHVCSQKPAGGRKQKISYQAAFLEKNKQSKFMIGHKRKNFKIKVSTERTEKQSITDFY